MKQWQIELLLWLVALLGATVFVLQVRGAEIKAPPLEMQNVYFRAWAGYSGLQAQWERSLTAEQRKLQEQLSKYGQQVASTMDELRKACDGRLDDAALQKDGKIQCLPPEPPTAEKEDHR